MRSANGTGSQDFFRLNVLVKTITKKLKLRLFSRGQVWLRAALKTFSESAQHPGKKARQSGLSKLPVLLQGTLHMVFQNLLAFRQLIEFIATIKTEFKRLNFLFLPSSLPIEVWRLSLTFSHHSRSVLRQSWSCLRAFGYMCTSNVDNRTAHLLLHKTSDESDHNDHEFLGSKAKSSQRYDCWLTPTRAKASNSPELLEFPAWLCSVW